MRRVWPTLSGAVALALAGQPAWAWNDHEGFTRLSLQAYESLPAVAFEPIAHALSALSVAGAKSPSSLADLVDQLAIHGDKVKWDWPTGAAPAELKALDVLMYSVIEADAGMDQNLDLGPDQKYMGGYSGPSSQGIRHMYYAGWSIFEPIATFHVPLREIGFAPERASLFFNLARQAAAGGHSFWAYRFLGLGLHYVQDMGQPYHATQFASPRLLPLWTLITKGWEPFVKESTRIVANFHLSFEHYTEYLMRPNQESELALAFKVPNGDEGLKIALEQDPRLSVRTGVKKLAAASAVLAPEIALRQRALMGTLLLAPETDLVTGSSVDFSKLEADPALKEVRRELRATMFKALSNTGVATRWYIDRFKAEGS